QDQALVSRVRQGSYSMRAHELRAPRDETHEAAVRAYSRREAGSIGLGPVGPNRKAKRGGHANRCRLDAGISQKDITPAVAVAFHQIARVGGEDDKPAIAGHRRRTARAIWVSPIPSDRDRNHMRRARYGSAEAAIAQKDSGNADFGVSTSVKRIRDDGL